MCRVINFKAFQQRDSHVCLANERERLLLPLLLLALYGTQKHTGQGDSEENKMGPFTAIWTNIAKSLCK
jgi:hypothetical protein